MITSDPRDGHYLEVYCPGCGQIVVVERETDYLLAPGDTEFTCPECEQVYTVCTEFVPKTQEAKCYR